MHCLAEVGRAVRFLKFPRGSKHVPYACDKQDTKASAQALHFWHDMLGNARASKEARIPPLVKLGETGIIALRCIIAGNALLSNAC